ncbi:MAG: alcohol dehydrogenase catalytic domain-containing protein [Armatimonadota bacterium]
MPDRIAAYRRADAPLPRRMLAWQLFGAGMDNFGRADQPSTIPLPEIGRGELLLRVDACGLCFSDIKIIRLGDQHPRLRGRDLSREPVTPGHEAALTVVKVGEDLAEQFAVGDRFVIQADIFYQGVGMAFGYALQGALAQYVAVGKEVLEGDEGCYLLPVEAKTGYAEAGLAEPWACVECSYLAEHRPGPKPDGVLLILADSTAGTHWELPQDPRPRLALIHDFVPESVRRQAARLARELHLVTGDLASIAQEHAPNGFDDVIALGPLAGELLESAATHLAPEGILAICSAEPLPEPVNVDVGRIHYDGIHFLGTDQPLLARAYQAPRESELAPRGAAWFIGAGGPMGQMHVQRAAQMRGGPEVILATDIDGERLALLERRFQPAAERRGARLVCLNPQDSSAEDFAAELATITDGRGFTDIVLLAPVPALIEQAAPFLAQDGVLNIFAGLVKGTTARLDLTPIAARGHRLTGTSGSRISHLELTLGKAESGELSPNGSVAAVGDLRASKEGLEGVRDGRFPGKVVIYPHLEDLPLTALPDLKDSLPTVYGELAEGEIWTTEAEAELFRLKLPEQEGGSP